jgi:Uncharacterised nucleotidyltransferase
MWRSCSRRKLEYHRINLSMTDTPNRQPFSSHRLALLAAAPNLTGEGMRDALAQVAADGSGSFPGFLLEHGLGSFWYYGIEAYKLAGTAEPGFLAALKQARLSETALYLAQKSALRELDRSFNSLSIVYAVIKGAYVRERVYADPSIRPAGDVDILVRPDQREAAAKALIGAGFRLQADAENISHEATFTRGAVAIDLHWDILRPGRTRVAVADLLLDGRQRRYEFWGLDDSDAVFLMLVHPAFAKYVCSPNMGLNRVADFIFWIHKLDVDWESVANRLESTGLNTAAWTVLKWFSMLVPPETLPVPDAFIKRISPGWVRAQYLTYWLKHDLPTRWLQKPLLIHLGFTLVLHDRLADAWHAISGLLRARATRNADPLLQMEH